MTPVTSWGRLSHHPHDVHCLASQQTAPLVLGRHKPGIAYGMGRSYGDACLNPGGVLWPTRGLDHFIHFDERTGRLRCEGGVLLRDIQQLAIPRGWMLAVTPGTQWVSVGGAIANDVHGKNHHAAGSFGNHVLHLRLLRTDGELIDCSPAYRTDWLTATVGGLGLTGVILEAELQLKKVNSAWLDTETVPYESLEEFFQIADESAQWEYTVSWVDCLSTRRTRGLFMRGNPAEQGPAHPPRARSLSMPFTPPVSLVNRLTLRPFNTAYYYANLSRPRSAKTFYAPFFYPLDHIRDWNRMYGPAGFFQYQCVIPNEYRTSAIHSMLTEIARSGEGSFLSVLKTFGEVESVGLLSFPRAGVTLALDFPNRGNNTLALFDRLDGIVREVGGRIYPAKDARMPRDLFEAGYPRHREFLPYRDPGISSSLSRRLLGS